MIALAAMKHKLVIEIVTFIPKVKLILPENFC